MSITVPANASLMSAFSLGGANSLALLKTWSVEGDSDLADASGIADRYEYNLAVKQGQKFDFTIFTANSGGIPSTNLDVTVWSIGGTDYLGRLRGGSLNVTTVTKERSSIASAYKMPNPNRTQVEVTSEFLVVPSALLTATVLTGTQAQFAVTVAITYGTEVFSCPMVLKSSKHTVDRGEMQMENVSLALQGLPTGPSDSSLLGNILLGTASIAIDTTTGANEYKTGTGQKAVISRLGVTFADGAILETQGTLEVQGGMTVVAPS